jgi:carboxypeptidase D
MAAVLLGSLCIRNVLAEEKKAADYLVKSLPGQPDGPLLRMHAGHVEVNPQHNGNLFFWHYANRHIGTRSRTVIWINGGPGCSSMDGALMELGPYRVKKGGEGLEYNNGSWDQWANLLFVDNPVGTGFSYVDTDSYVHELDEMADQFITFLEKWFALFPEYITDDLYIAGESYAGEHIPYIARAILDKAKTDPTSWNLKGLLIGNGWISPVDQYLAYLPFAYEHGLIERKSAEAEQVESTQRACVKSLNGGGSDKVDSPTCENILQTILRVTRKENEQQSCLNMYDIRLRDAYPSCGMNWPPDLTNVTPYLRRKDVTRALNINSDKKTGWTECNGAVGTQFTAKKSVPAIALLPDLLRELPIVLFSGDQDLICNHIGTEKLISNMKWQGGQGFQLPNGGTAPRRKWIVDGEPAGYYQEARNLTYVLFYNSSHMVPFDHSARSRDMLHRFIGLDVDSLLGEQVDSNLEGERQGQGSNKPNESAAAVPEAAQDLVDDAKKHAYYRSGEVALVFVIIGAALWGWFAWRGRRGRGGYFGVNTADDVRLNGSRMRSLHQTDEEAGEFEIDDSDTFSSDGESDHLVKSNEHEDREMQSVSRVSSYGGGSKEPNDSEKDSLGDPAARGT